MYRRPTRQRLALAALVAASATVLTLDFRRAPGGPIRRIQDGAIAVVAPLQEGISQILGPVGGVFSGLRELTNLREENERLRERLHSLEAARRDFPETARERERLLSLLEERDWKSGKTLGARVIGAGPSSLEWSAFLNKGRSHGVAEGMAVVAAEGLVGRIVVAGEKYSKALLLVDPEHSVGSRLVGSGETGVVTGAGGAEMPFELIDQTTPVQEGETVVTSGYDRGIYPPGIPIGRVSRVVRSRDGLSKTASVRPFVDFTRLDLILLLLESGPSGPGIPAQ